MNSARLSNSATHEDQKLPRRDWILLPAFSLMTIFFMIAISEFISSRFFQETNTSGEDCMVSNTASKGFGGIPNSVCWEKIREGDLISYRLNNSGYRSDTNFEPKSPGTFRIVVIGSSYSVGLRVSIEDAFATRLASELSQLTGKKIEILNLGMSGLNATPSIVGLRFQDALALQPDLILQILNSWDIQMQSVKMPTREQFIHPAAPVSSGGGLKNIFFDHHLGIGIMIRHFLYQSQTQYVKTSLTNLETSNYTGFLKSGFDDDWKKHLSDFEKNDATIEEIVKAAGVPMVTVFLPIRVQAAMISMDEWPTGYDPYKLDNDLRTIITSHGGTYIDILPEYRNIPNPEQGFYPFEGHPNPLGHATIANLLALQLTSGVVPALNATTPPHTPSEQEK